MASNIGTTTIRYKVFGRDDERTMSIGTQHAATFAKRMIGQKAWTSAKIDDVDQNGKLETAMNSALPSNHVNATPALNQLTTHAKKLESASIKRLITETEREALLLHTLEAMKELGMSVERVDLFVDRVYGTKVAASSPAPAPVTPTPPAELQKTVTNMPAPEKKPGGIFSR